MKTNSKNYSSRTLLGSSFDRAIDRLRQHYPNYVLADYGTLYTNAFWRLQYEICEEYYDKKWDEKETSYIEEIVACLLGGFGFKAEIGWAAFNRLKTRKLIRRDVCLEKLVEALSEPIQIGDTCIHYRFPIQKSRYVYDFLSRSDLDNAPLENDLEFRTWLLTINGIGPKTASWITRNVLHSDNVAIIDIHLYRAGVLTGFISPDLDVQKDYFEIEKCFLSYCHLINVRPSVMDMIMWINMKNTNKIAINLINKQF